MPEATPGSLRRHGPEARVGFRPSFAGAAKQFALLGGLYFVLAVALCVSLSLWLLRPVFALLAFVVIVAAMTWAFARTFRGTTVTVTDTTVTLHSIWGQPDRVLNRSEITRMMPFDRLKGSLPMSVLLVVDRDRQRLGGAGWLWSDELMAHLMAALADERLDRLAADPSVVRIERPVRADRLGALGTLSP